MSKLKTTLDALDQKLSASEKLNDDIQQSYFKQHRKVQTERDNILRQYIQENNLLNICTWNLIVEGTQIRLTAREYDIDDPKTKELFEYIETDYHCQFNLVAEPYEDNPEYEKGFVTIYFDDGEIQILFDDIKYVAKFIKDFGLNVDTHYIDDKLKRLQTTMEELQLIKSQVTA